MSIVDKMLKNKHVKKNIVEVLATSPSRHYLFRFWIHHSENTDDQMMERAFYEKWSKVHEGDHHEIQILEPDLGAHEAGKVHYHVSKKENGGKYICWTGPLPKLSHAMIIIENWTGGAVHAMETGIDFKETFKRYGSEIMKMKEVMEKEHGIKVEVLKS